MFNVTNFIRTSVLAIIFQAPAYAEEVKMFNTPPSAEEMGKILFSNEAGAASDSGMKTRSISFGKKSSAPAEAAPKKQKHKQPEATSGEAIGLPIQFGYNSAEIIPDSIPFIAEIGKMLGLEEFSQKRLVIEGHTDAAGSDDYNKYLSKRRAESVKEYLVGNYKISPNRLVVKGLGESNPLPGSDPNDAVNRRVQLRSAQ